jgi:hypothetical protein
MAWDNPIRVRESLICVVQTVNSVGHIWAKHIDPNETQKYKDYIDDKEYPK